MVNVSINKYSQFKTRLKNYRQQLSSLSSTSRCLWRFSLYDDEKSRLATLWRKSKRSKGLL